MSRLVLDRVTKVFTASAGNVTALVEFNLTVAPGELVLLKGPSGAGKSTLLFIAGALLEPTSGLVRFEGRDLYRLPASERAVLRQTRIGFVFQSFHLIPYLTAEENALLVATGSTSRTPQEARTAVQQLFDRFGLSPRRSHLPAQMSVGERQRLALLRALVLRPDLILADEPTGNLDTENTALVIQSLVEHCAAGGSVLMATHSDTHDRWAQKIVHLRNGRVTT